ncbi:MAG: RNA polymerase-interacting CarD/CdnL/TRCF family regulator [Bacteriovoracaceae bacterium]|jgi:RNA polymerase-interacting CarD/CdnL/TRCF family regulator
MTEELNPIGKQILSIAFGVGTIQGIEKLDANGDDFYVVEFANTKTKNYFPINENRKMRFLSTKDYFMENLEKLKAKAESKKFQNKKERQQYFASCLSSCDLGQVVNLIHEISSIDDLITFEKEKFQKLVKVLELEASALYEMGPIKSKEFISDILESA